MVVNVTSIAATDGQLLDCYVRDRDPGAFRRLVARHGPAVLQVCRGVLHDVHEADDAFQATFMVLVRKAPSIQSPEALGGWLRGVAYRTAMRARCRAARRLAIERTCAGMSRPEASAQELSLEIRQLIRSELERLPENYRQPVMLCYLESMTHVEAAEQLGWPVGTVKVRLVRGRRLLRERLDRRGVYLGAALVFWLLDPSKAGPVPGQLVESTILVMKLAAAGRDAALRSRFRGAVEMAGSFRSWGRAFRHAHWIWPVLLGLIVWSVSSSGVLAFHRPPVTDVDPATLPSNLTDVLNIDCN
jgi:RNA polymerase sigma factor (sigma-70 family)